MKIRSVTCFLDPGHPLSDEGLQAAGVFLAAARTAFEAGGYPVQTTRLAASPFPRVLKDVALLPRYAEALGRALPRIGIDYAALGPALPAFPASYAIIPEAISASENVFFSAIAAEDGRIDLAALSACAQVIVRNAAIMPDGFANLRFAVLANVPPGSPFFPAAYHAGGAPRFAVAAESADLAVDAFRNAGSLAEGRQDLVDRMTRHGRHIADIAAGLQAGTAAGAFSPSFGGIDFSLAPFPDDSQSLGAAVEHMGVPAVGNHASLAAAAILTEAIERADFPHTGFCGFMQPVLEDSVLARRAAEGTLGLKDLLLYSAVCGTGLDTVPLPGDTRPEELLPLLLDLAALSARLDKPLTARLMPIPGKRAGDPTRFDFGFFANSRVMALDSHPLQGVLGSATSLALAARRR